MAEEQVYKKASGFFPTPDGKTIEIRDVWASNLADEMAHIREILEKFPYVAMVCAIGLRLLLSLLLFVLLCGNSICSCLRFFLHLSHISPISTYLSHHPLLYRVPSLS